MGNCWSFFSILLPRCFSTRGVDPTGCSLVLVGNVRTEVLEFIDLEAHVGPKFDGRPCK